MHKPFIQEVIVVEGKSDTIKLQSLFDVDTIETNGSYLSKETINLIKHISEERGIILFLDPDGPGETIRRRLENSLTNFKQVFIAKKDAIHQNKVGVAEASNQAIVKALNQMVTFNRLKESITWRQYLSLNLNSASKRKIVCDYFHISESNNKQLFKRLNMMNVDHATLLEIIN